MDYDDINDIFINVIVGFGVILAAFAFVLINVLVAIYADWLQVTMSMATILLAYVIGKYIRSKKK